MIIDDLDRLRPAVLPHEANPPLIVDPDAKLAGAVSLQGLQTIPRRNPKVLQRPSTVQVKKLSASYSVDAREPRHMPIPEQGRSVLATERPDHPFLLTQYITRVVFRDRERSET